MHHARLLRLPALPRLPALRRYSTTPSGSIALSKSHDEKVATLTIQSERKLNTLNSPLMGQFISALNSLESDPELRCVVLKSAGEKSWVGGVDITEMARLDASSAREMITRVHQTCRTVREFPVPVVARIDGFCLGGGLELAASCDVRMATRKSVFGMPETKVGIPSVVEAALLPGLIGWGKTRWFLLTGENVSAATIEKWGFLEALVDTPAELDAEVEKFVHSILEAGPNAIKIQKRLIGKWEAGLGMQQSVEAGINAFAEAYGTSEPGDYMKRVFLDRKRAK